MTRFFAAEWLDSDEGEILVVSDLGYAKRSLVADYPVQGRGGKGIFTFEFKEGKRVKPNGTALVGAFAVKEPFDISAVISTGERATISTEQAPIEDRKAPGKQLIPVGKNDKITDLLRFV
ncbi:hypothetical protein LJK88_30025 [Paenibacillus sp. P26]|nr:hypothetical protein LJK88_30025 [Paenibacillus sp. P26]UUZ94487.1 hypothetical protein LJK87_08045 [Paenibacillus sp. P25]